MARDRSREREESSGGVKDSKRSRSPDSSIESTTHSGPGAGGPGAGHQVSGDTDLSLVS